ncbi:hypothetical protein ACFL0H_13320 [Thermodesulfobacteriota bacterium]
MNKIWLKYLMPLHIPIAVETAAFLPFDIPCVTTKILSGPGAIVSNMDAPRE